MRSELTGSGRINAQNQDRIRQAKCQEQRQRRRDGAGHHQLLNSVGEPLGPREPLGPGEPNGNGTLK